MNISTPSDNTTTEDKMNKHTKLLSPRESSIEAIMAYARMQNRLFIKKEQSRVLNCTKRSTFAETKQNNMSIVSPSLLSADFANLANDIDMINRSDADWLHLDIMDGVFVPNISFGFPVIESIKDKCTKPFDVHLMIVEPDKFIDNFAKAGASIINVHYEACTHLHRTIQKIKATGAKAAVTLNPHTPVCLLEDIVTDVDMVLLMSVNPGYGGQKFIPNTLEKTRQLKELILRKNSKAIIEIDGGVNDQTGKQLVECGADALVAGNYVFKSPDPIETIKLLKQL